MHNVVLLHRCYPSTPHGVGPWLPAPYPTQEVTMHTHSAALTHREIAEAQMLNSVWLEADDMDVGFAAHASYLTESLTLVHDSDLSIRHVPTQRFTDNWLDYIEEAWTLEAEADALLRARLADQLHELVELVEALDVSIEQVSSSWR